MRLITANKIILQKKLICPVCYLFIHVGESVWCEEWEDLDKRDIDFVHIWCKGKEESREEYRNRLIEYLEKDQG